MKKLITIILALLIISCSDDSMSDYSIQDIKYFTRNGVKVGTIVKRDLKNKKTIFLTYPEYTAQSYQLIKYLSSIVSEYGLTGVYLLNSPQKDNNRPVNELLLEESPMLAFNEFIDLYDYLDENNISLINNIDSRDGKFLILSPEKKFTETRNYIEGIFEKSDILYLCMNGIQATEEVNQVIDNLPQAKKISTIPLTNSRFNKLNEDYYAVILMGSSDDYKKVTPIELYTKENYMKAPQSFIDKNKFPIKSFQIKRMNSYLKREIGKSKD